LAFDHTPWRVTFADGQSVEAALAGRRPEDMAQVAGFVPRVCLSWPAQRSFGPFSFAGSRFISFDFPGDVAQLGDGVFYGSSLEKIVLPDSVCRVGKHCFAHCHKLREDVLGPNLAEVSEDMFAECCALEQIRFGHLIEEQKLFEVLISGTFRARRSSEFLYSVEVDWFR
jgi:hypothetical protein